MTCFAHRLNKIAQTQVKNGNQNLRCSFLCFHTKPPGQQRQTASTEMPTVGCKTYVKNLFQFLCKAAVYRQGETHTATLLPPVLFGDTTWQKRWQYWAKPLRVALACAKIQRALLPDQSFLEYVIAAIF